MDVRVDGVRNEGNERCIMNRTEHPLPPAMAAMGPMPPPPFERDNLEAAEPSFNAPAAPNPHEKAQRGRYSCVGTLPVINVGDLEANDGVPSSVYLRSIESLSLSLKSHGAAALRPSPQDETLLQCTLQSARLFFRQPSTQGTSFGTQRKGSGGSRGGSHESSLALSQSYSFRAGELDMERHREAEAPPCLDRLYSSLGRVARVALAALQRGIPLVDQSLQSRLDACPLKTGETSSSSLAVWAHHHPSIQATSRQDDAAERGGEYTVKAEEQERINDSQEGVEEKPPPVPKASTGEDNQVIQSSDLTEQVVPGLLALHAADMPGLEVKDSKGKWQQVDKGLPPGCLLLLPGELLSEASQGLCSATPYRLSSAPPLLGSNGYTHSIARCSLSFSLNLRDKVAPLSTPAEQVSGLPSSSSAGYNASPLPLASPLAGPLHSLSSVLKDPISGCLMENAVLAPCGHSFGGPGLQQVIATMLCLHCKEPIASDSLVPNLAVRAAVAALKQEQSRFLANAQGSRSSGNPVRQRKSAKRPGMQSPHFQTDRAGSEGLSGKLKDPDLGAALFGMEARESRDSPRAADGQRRQVEDREMFEAREVLDKDDEDEDENLPLSGEELPIGSRFQDHHLQAWDMGGGAGPPPSAGVLKIPKKKKDKESRDLGSAEEWKAGEGVPRPSGKKTVSFGKLKPGRGGTEGPFSPESYREREREREKDRVDGSGTRLKGVQFPFAVNDRVLIKGNKRTPEKFVGREAIITSQCLNGWYLVRTLDTGDSVRLQYRSLQRSGSAGGGRQGVHAEGATDSMQLALLPSQSDHNSDQAMPTASPPFCTGQQLATRALSPLTNPLRPAYEPEFLGHSLPGLPGYAQEKLKTQQRGGSGVPMPEWLGKGEEVQVGRWAEGEGSADERSGVEALGFRMFMGPQGAQQGQDDSSLGEDWGSAAGQIPGRASLVELSLAVAAVSQEQALDSGQDMSVPGFGVLGAGGGWQKQGARKKAKVEHARDLLSLSLDHGEGPIEEGEIDTSGTEQGQGSSGRQEEHVGPFMAWPVVLEQQQKGQGARESGGLALEGENECEARKPKPKAKQHKTSSGVLSVKLKVPGKLQKVKHAAPAPQEQCAGRDGERREDEREGDSGRKRSDGALQTCPADGETGLKQGVSSEVAVTTLAPSLSMMPLKKRDLFLGKSGTSPGLRQSPAVEEAPHSEWGLVPSQEQPRDVDPQQGDVGDQDKPLPENGPAGETSAHPPEDTSSVQKDVQHAANSKSVLEHGGCGAESEWKGSWLKLTDMKKSHLQTQGNSG